MPDFSHPRNPSKRARMVATTGAVIIHTDEGNVVMTPQLARIVAGQLGELADLADKKNPVKEPDKNPYPVIGLWKEELLQCASGLLLRFLGWRSSY